MKPVSVIAAAGAMYLGAVLVLAITQAPLGSPMFFAVAALAAIAYVIVVVRVWHEPASTTAPFYVALALAAAFRVPLAVAPVGPDNDMMRYLWDGRVQRLGLNPYEVLPSNPDLAWTHTDETRRMPSARDRTPYPPGAQLFFRLVVSVRDSSRAMKLALTACDLLTMIVVWRWLAAAGRSPWLTLAYAWHPLVVLDVAHSGHVDALGALWIAASACWLARRRTLLAAIALVLAIATKLLPVVLLPLFWRRIRRRDALLAIVLLLALYLPFMSGQTVPLGAVPNVVARIRFNGPAFKALAATTSPQAAAALAVGLGLAVAAWARVRLGASDPSAWAWPMAIALACAPVIYPWYLLYLTPFLFAASTIPLLVWTLSVLSVYVVWDLSRHGGRWVVPAWVMALEFLPVLAVAIASHLERRPELPRESEDL